MLACLVSVEEEGRQPCSSRAPQERYEGPFVAELLVGSIPQRPAPYRVARTGQGEMVRQKRGGMLTSCCTKSIYRALGGNRIQQLKSLGPQPRLQVHCSLDCAVKRRSAALGHVDECYASVAVYVSSLRTCPMFLLSAVSGRTGSERPSRNGSPLALRLFPTDGATEVRKKPGGGHSREGSKSN